MSGMRVLAYALAIAAALGTSQRADATALKQSCDFRLETWCDINQTDGPVTIHRARVTTTDVGIRSIGASSELNDSYLRRVGIQIEYTNDGGRKYKSSIEVRWIDAEGDGIDGFSDDEGLEAHRARAMIKRSIAANKYGLGKAKTLEIEVDVNP